MKMAQAVIAVMLLLLTGSIYQTYEQTMDLDGDSVITREEDANLFLGLFGDDALQKIEQVCAEDSSLGCSYSEGKLKLTENFQLKDGYYQFETSYGLPYIEYTLEVNKIPTDRFMKKLSEVLVAAGLSDYTDQSGRAIDLSNKEENAEMAKLMRDSQLGIAYVIEMQGEIFVASAGEANGDVEYSRVTFSLEDVLSESEPIVVKSRELNLGFILFILAILIMGAFAASFFFGKKKG